MHSNTSRILVLFCHEFQKLIAGMKRISEKRTKNQAKMDKTKHEMEKRRKAKVKSKPKSKKDK
ncbi:hypothetical protein Tco_0391885, partial [Tanacetum coccineum]